jgi:hypothetical protein
MSYYYHIFAYIGLLVGLYAFLPITIELMLIGGYFRSNQPKPHWIVIVVFFGIEIAASAVCALLALLVAWLLKVLWRGCVSLKNKLD